LIDLLKRATLGMNGIHHCDAKVEIERCDAPVTVAHGVLHVLQPLLCAEMPHED